MTDDALYHPIEVQNAIEVLDPHDFITTITVNGSTITLTLVTGEELSYTPE